MPAYEYKVIPAPNRAVRVKGIKGTEARFANAVQGVMNDQAADGWEYLRTDTLPCEERQGLRGRTTVYQNLLVFRRGTQSPPVTVLEPENEAAAAVPVAPVEPVHPPQAMVLEADSGAAVARLGPAVRHPDVE
ncbi:MAG: DUF4177 domain-containing protein [Paracoccaceae bacterium]